MRVYWDVLRICDRRKRIFKTFSCVLFWQLCVCYKKAFKIYIFYQISFISKNAAAPCTKLKICWPIAADATLALLCAKKFAMILQYWPNKNCAEGRRRLVNEFVCLLIYRVFIKYCVFPRCQCVYTHQAGRKPALQQNWKSSEKSQNFKEKTQYFMNTLYISEYNQLYIYAFTSALLNLLILKLNLLNLTR